MSSSLREDDSVAKPLDKSEYDDNPTEQINIDKIQLPGGIAQNEEDHPSSLFSKPPSFKYEKDIIQKAQIKFNELDPTGSNTNSHNEQCILDKYKEQLNKPAKVLNEEAKETRKMLRRQQTLQKKKHQKEVAELVLEVDAWGEKLDRLASVVRLVGLIVVTLLCGVGIFFLIRKFGNNMFLLWFALEIVDDAYVIFLGFTTIKTLNVREPNIEVVLRLKMWIYIAFGLQAVMVILGFALIKYSKGFKVSGDRSEQSDGLYNILGLLFTILGFVKVGLIVYWFYLYRKYLPLYEKYYEKEMSSPDFAGDSAVSVGGKAKKQSDSPANAI